MISTSNVGENGKSLHGMKSYDHDLESAKGTQQNAKTVSSLVGCPTKERWLLTKNESVRNSSEKISPQGHNRCTGSLGSSNGLIPISPTSHLVSIPIEPATENILCDKCEGMIADKRKINVLDPLKHEMETSSSVNMNEAKEQGADEESNLEGTEREESKEKGRVSFQHENDSCGELAPEKRTLSRWTVTRGRKSYSRKKKSRGLNERSFKEYTFVMFASLGLSFNSGYINGCCLSGLLLPEGNGIRQSVAGFTGTYTKAGLALAAGNFSVFGFEMSVVMSFIAGAFISALINPRGVPYRLDPAFGPTFLLGSLLLGIASILAFVYPSGIALFYFAAAANGLQNGMSSTYSGNLIRTTHLTGTSTDIGLILGQIVRGNRTNLWKLWVLVGLTTAFWTGGVISFLATTTFRGYSLIFNAVLFFLIGCGLVTFLVLTEHISFWQAATGRWKWKKAIEKLNISCRGTVEPSRYFLYELFDRIDLDDNGFIEQKELYQALDDAGVHTKSRNLRAMMKAADGNEDGKISRDEWEQLVEGLFQDEWGSHKKPNKQTSQIVARTRFEMSKAVARTA